VSEDRDALEGEACLSLIWDVVEDVLTKGFEDSFLVLSNKIDVRGSC
jgi:hypothetical protein